MAVLLEKLQMHFGIFNASKKSSLSNLIIEVSEENVFVNCERELKVKGYDKYFNPIDVDIEDIKWSISGVDGKIENGKLIAGNEPGTIKITAKKGKATTTISLDILSEPNEIVIEPKKACIEKDEKITFNITAKNKNGYYASIKNSELKWNILSGDGKIENGVYTPSKEGLHLIEVSSDNAKSYALIEVSGTKESFINYIEDENYSFVSYPKEVIGSIEKDDENYINLSYDFTNTIATRAAYLRFKEPILLDENSLNLSFDIISEKTIPDYIKLKIVDAEDADKLLLVKRGFEESKTAQNLSISLKDVKLPAKLTDIYIGQDNQEVLSEGTIKIGNIKLTSKTNQNLSNITLPKDIKGIDSANISPSSSGDLKIVIYDSINTPTLLLDKFKNSKVESELDKNSDLIILTSQGNEEIQLNVTKPIIKTSSYNKTSYENTDIITIDVSNGGLRNTDYSQWLNLQTDIKNSNNKNILILMKGNLNNFTDSKEKQLFIDVMCELKRNTNKNIWIITTGENTTYSMERGIRYLSINNENFDTTEPLEVAKNTSYILITIDNNNLTYEVKNVF